MNDLQQLNTQFAIEDQLRFEQIENGFIIINIDNEYAKASISIYGGQVLSYQPHKQDNDLLFLSNKTSYQAGKAIRGGIPICWPWFGNDTSGYGRPAHGFVRNQPWNVIASMANSDGSTTVTMGLQETEGSLGIWPYKFQLEIEITVGKQLTIKLTTKNTDNKAFEISQSLHAYLQLGNIQQSSIFGLDGNSYLDKTDNLALKIQMGDVVINQEIDRIYQSPAELIVNDTALNRKITIHSQGSNSSVIWNPWQEGSASISDLDTDDYKRFVCVEAANAAEDTVTIDAGHQYCLQAEYSI